MVRQVAPSLTLLAPHFLRYDYSYSYGYGDERV
jgi:hypothetical protein